MNPQGGQDRACALFVAQDVGSPNSGSREGMASSGLSRTHGPPAGRAGQGCRRRAARGRAAAPLTSRAARSIHTDG